MFFIEGRERLNTWTFREYCKNILMILIKVPIWLLQLLLFWLPLKKNRIIIYSLKQRGYCCNLKYLTEYLTREMPGEFELLWVVKSVQDYELLKSRNVPVAMAVSRAHFRYRMSAGIVITNDEFYPMFRKRRGQRYVNTWHGGLNYKKIGYSGLIFTNPIQKLIYRMNNPKPDCFVSGSRSFTQTASEAFRFPKEIFLECGLPRNDVLCTPQPCEKIDALRRSLGIPEGNRVLLYAPTFRKGNNGPESMLDFNTLAACLGERFGGTWSILLRQHYFVREAAAEDTAPYIDVSHHEDMQELLLCSDCLLSDYSSCMWDYLLTGRPCFVFAPDLQEYCASDRSFFIPMEAWPYPISTTTQELWDAIRRFDYSDFARKREDHIAQCGSFDQGNACAQLAHILTDRR